jgi:hypothetical protein
MTWFVVVDRIKGRRDFYDLVFRLSSNGFEDRVEYFEGGWQDGECHTVATHLKFEREDDAFAYVLAFGGEISKKIPIRLI